MLSNREHTSPNFFTSISQPPPSAQERNFALPIFSRMAQLGNNRAILRNLAHTYNWHIHKFLLKPFQFLYLNFKAVIIKGVFSKVIPNSYVFILGKSTSLRDFSLRTHSSGSRWHCAKDASNTSHREQKEHQLLFQLRLHHEYTSFLRSSVYRARRTAQPCTDDASRNRGQRRQTDTNQPTPNRLYGFNYTHRRAPLVYHIFAPPLLRLRCGTCPVPR